MSTRLFRNISVAAVVLLAPLIFDATLVTAQTATPTPTPSAAASPEVEPDLSITARVRARELRFETVPNPTVEFSGQPRRETVWEADRENLPRPVRPGETYRDIGIRLRITSVFADIERIVAEALGEVPATNDVPNPVATPATPPQTPDTSERSPDDNSKNISSSDAAPSTDAAPPAPRSSRTSSAPRKNISRAGKGRPR